MRPQRKKFLLGGLVLLLAIVCPQLAVPLLESGVVACAISPDCSDSPGGSHVE